MLTAASARISVSLIACTSPPRGRSTSPRTPASDTRMLDPPPSNVTGTFAADARRSAATSSSAVRVSTIQSATPPTRNVVKAASGTSARARAPNALLSASKNALMGGPFPRAPSAAVRGQSARRGPCLEHTANETASPGPSCPATPTSALITVATIGYPPVVGRSAINRIGCPDGGTCLRASLPRARRSSTLRCSIVTTGYLPVRDRRTPVRGRRSPVRVRRRPPVPGPPAATLRV
jgi:hypothetical protein